MIRNTFVNNYRKAGRNRNLINPHEELTLADLLFNADHNKADENFVIADINRALEAFPDIYSIPFVRYIGGYRYKEIAIEQNIPMGIVKTHIHEARIVLKQQLKS